MGSFLEDVNGSGRQFLTYEQGHGIATRRASQGHQCLTDKSVLYVFGTCYLHQMTDVQMRGEEMPLTATECQNKMHPETNTNVINTSNTNQSQHHGKTENKWVCLGVQAVLGPTIRIRYMNLRVLCVLWWWGWGVLSDETADMFVIASHRLCRLYAFTYTLRLKPLYILLNTYKYFNIHGLRPLRPCRL